MTETTGPRKIAILGGGIGGLATAFEMTSQPGWRDRYDITIHQLGWRLGGKCASSRGPNARIEEHGIHGFVGSYFNALTMMKACYDELGRPKDAPLATFEDAFLPEHYSLMWEWRDGGLRKWAQIEPDHGNGLEAIPALGTPEAVLGLVLKILAGALDPKGAQTTTQGALIDETLTLVSALAAIVAAGVKTAPAPKVQALRDQWSALAQRFLAVIEQSDIVRRMFLTADYILALILGFLADDIANKGYQAIDDENWSDWLARQGAQPQTISCPLAMSTVNLAYQYPDGDTALPPRMAAGAYLQWTLGDFAYVGPPIWMFACGTGETVIAPLYEVLRKRGVKFAFFHKVEALHLNADRTEVAAVRIGVQAHLKDPSRPYEPLDVIGGVPSWSAAPKFDQLVEGEALRAAGVDLESYWTPWKCPGSLTLRAGHDYDQLVFAISIGAVPHLCKELIDANPAWKTMVESVPTVTTQALQIWLSKDIYDLGFDLELDGQPGAKFQGTDTVTACTYLDAPNGQAEFRHLLKWEAWPAGHEPKSLWYICGLKANEDPPPPFTDHDYPRRAKREVRAQFIQYLQGSIGPLLPNATVNAVSPPGDPVGLDFSLLVDPSGSKAQGVSRIDSQFIRVNIDPTERYVTTPPGSTQHRIKAWETGFANLTIAGDWIYTGLNVGSVEGATMGGRLACHALTGAPALKDIHGFAPFAEPAP